MKSPNNIILNRAEFKSDDEFYDALSKEIRFLLETKNVISIQENITQPGMFSIQFDSSAIGSTSNYPMWLADDEILYISAYQRSKEYARAKQLVENYEEDDNWQGNRGVRKPKNNNGGNTSDA